MAAEAPLEHDLKNLLRALCMIFLALPAAGNAELHVVVIEGLGGEQRYADDFDEQVRAVVDAANSMTGEDHVRVFRAAEAARADVLEYFDRLETGLSASDQLAVFLIGHGSYDDHEYKFNIRGPDLSGKDIVAMLDKLPSTHQLVVNMSSASGAIADLARNDNRMLILATRSGVERHATRFGNYFAAALNDPTADLDKNRIITAAEAFDFAERQVGDYFERNGQLATEHPRIEGDRARRFGLARLGTPREATDDPLLIELMAERDALNAQIEALRLEQENLPPDEYRSQLLQNMVELAQTEEAIEVRQSELDAEN